VIAVAKARDIFEPFLHQVSFFNLLALLPGLYQLALALCLLVGL
jgi:hypothetical protein